MRRGRHSTLAAVAVLVIGAAGLLAQDWPQWRGPNRDGLGGPVPLPSAWPKVLKSAWKREVGSGHSSPVVAGKAVYLHSRQGEEEVVARFDLGSGEPAWRQAYPAAYSMNPAARGHGKGPKSTPVVGGGRLYTLGISGILSCFDVAKGALVWRKDFAARFRNTSPVYGTAMSPTLEAGALIAHLGGHDEGAVIAFDGQTGKERWTWTADGPGYASPVVATIAGTRQVITQTQAHLVSLSAATGELLWKVPFTTSYDQNAVTPVVRGDVVVFSGLEQPLRAVEVVRRGAGWATEPVWENADLPLYMSSPVLVGNRLFGLTHRRKGQLFALDAGTGRTLWTSEGRAGDNAALVAAGSVVFALTTDSQLVVMSRDAAGYAPLATYEVATSPTWAHPAVTAAGVLVKDAEHLALWRWQ